MDRKLCGDKGQGQMASGIGERGGRDTCCLPILVSGSVRGHVMHLALVLRSLSLMAAGTRRVSLSPVWAVDRYDSLAWSSPA